MNFKNVKNLLYLNLIYTVVPATLDKLRKKNKNKRVNLQGIIIRQHLLLAIVYVCIFGIGAAVLNGNETKFLTFVSVFSVFAILQGVLSVFNVFYESNDMSAYMPLPFSDLEIFAAKIISCLLSIVYFVAPIILYCVFIQFNFKHALYQSVLFGVLSSALITTAIILTSVILTYLLTKLPAFKKHKKVATAVMTAVIIIGTILMIVIMNTSTIRDGAGVGAAQLIEKMPFLSGVNQVFWLFFGIAENPFSVKVLVHLIAWIAAIAAELFICIKMIIPNIYADATEMQTLISSAKRKKLKAHGSSLRASLLHYHLGFLTDTQVLISCIIMPPIMIPMMLFPNLMNFSHELKEVVFTYNYILVSVVAGGMYALLSIGALSSIIISLDKENYNFIKSLPFDMAKYIKYKFYFAYVLQILIPFICILGIAAILRLPWFLIVAALLTTALAAIPICTSTIRKDHENLLLDWTNVIQLSQRGGSKAVMFGKFFGIIILGTAGVMISVFVAESASFAVIAAIVAVIYAFIFVYTRYSINKTVKYFKENL